MERDAELLLSARQQLEAHVVDGPRGKLALPDRAKPARGSVDVDAGELRPGRDKQALPQDARDGRDLENRRRGERPKQMGEQEKAIP